MIDDSSAIAISSPIAAEATACIGIQNDGAMAGNFSTILLLQHSVFQDFASLAATAKIAGPCCLISITCACVERVYLKKKNWSCRNGWPRVDWASDGDPMVWEWCCDGDGGLCFVGLQRLVSGPLALALAWHPNHLSPLLGLNFIPSPTMFFLLAPIVTHVFY